MNLTDAQISVLRQLQRLKLKPEPVLIGASALALRMDFRRRQTNDLDISLSMDLEDLSTDLPLPPDWNRDPRIEHRWRTPAGVTVDILPVGPRAREAGILHWPKSGNVMKTTGFRLVFEQAQVVSQGTLKIRVAPVPVVALLKMVAYREAPAERGRDLDDLALIFEDYPEDESRLFAPEVVRVQLSFAQSRPFLLGRELAAIVDKAERAEVQAFIAKALDENDPQATLAKLTRAGASIWREHPEEVPSLLTALRQGLDDAR